MTSNTYEDGSDRGIDYLVVVDSLVYTQYVNELKILYMNSGNGKELNVVTKIMPGGAAAVWFAVHSVDKTGHREETTTYVTLESALKVYNEIRVE